MITVGGKYDFSFEYMGFFVGEPGWIHPRFLLDTTEIVFVTDGEVYIEEDGERYALGPGEILFLDPGVVHEGYKGSASSTRFYWLHYRLSDAAALPLGKRYRPADAYSYVNLFKQLNHFFLSGDLALTETRLLAALMELSRGADAENKLAHDVAEYVRMKISSAPDVRSVAKRFGYSADHLSKVFAGTFRAPLKKFIDRERLAYVQSCLLSTEFSIKQIAEAGGFPDENNLVKFFKYHAGETPTAFRNHFYASHTNER